MRAVIQRVTSARVLINEKEYSRIGRGLLVLVGVEKEDTNEDAEALARRIVERLDPRIPLSFEQLGAAGPSHANEPRGMCREEVGHLHLATTGLSQFFGLRVAAFGKIHIDAAAEDVMVAFFDFGMAHQQQAGGSG